MIAVEVLLLDTMELTVTRHSTSRGVIDIDIKISDSANLNHIKLQSLMITSAFRSSNTATTELCPAPVAIIRAVKPNWKYS